MSAKYITPYKAGKYQSATHHSASPNQHLSGHCVCEICTCTKHRCPPKPINYAPDLKSTFKNDYPPYDVNRDRVKRGGHKYVPTNYNPDLMKTTHQQDYTPKKVSAPERRDQNPYVTSNTPFNGESEYKHSYIPNEVNQAHPFKHNPQKNKYYNNVPFNAHSTYIDSYKGLPGQKNDHLKTRSQDVGNVHVPFNGSTTYQNEYIKRDIPRGRDNNKKGLYQPNKVPFDSKTSYQHDYLRHGPGYYDKERCKIYDLPPRPRQCSPGKNHLYYHAEDNFWD